jgi:hypothetical protein
MAIATNLSQENATLWIIANQLFGEMARYQPPFGFALSWINSLFLEKKFSDTHLEIPCSVA